MNLYDFLQEVRKRPGMYVPNNSLHDLEKICHGYTAALSTHGIAEFGTQFNTRFRDYLFEQHGWSMCQGWAKGIRAHCRSDETAFARFFKLVDEFKKAED